MRIFASRQAALATSIRARSLLTLASSRLHFITIIGHAFALVDTEYSGWPPGNEARQMGLGHLPLHL